MLFIVIQEPKPRIRDAYNVRIVVVESKTRTEAIRGMPDHNSEENKKFYRRPRAWALELGNEYHG